MADTKISALSSASTLDGTEQVPVVQGGVTKKCTISDIRTIDIVKVLASNATSSSTTAAAMTDLNASLVPGTYLVKLWMLFQSAATTTGLSVFLNASGGTVSACASTWYSLTTDTVTTTTATGVMDQASAAGTFQVMGGRAQRASNTSGGPFGGVDTANADQFAVLEGIVIVTATTTLQVMLASEVAASTVTMKTGTTVCISKVA